MKQPQTTPLGAIKGRLLVFGGVYSNWQALQAMRAVANELAIPKENIICTGDIVAYCAQPEACVQAMKDWGVPCIAGNVEIQLREGAENCACDFTEGSRCDNFSKEWYPFAQAQLSEDALAWMRTLPNFLSFNYAGKKAMVVHGSYHNTSEFIFASTDWKVKQQNFASTNTDLILAGHCGLPFAQVQANQYWLNAGVIGMPANDGTPRVWYLLLDDRDGELTYEYHALTYDFKAANREMQAQQLTPAYAKTLLTGIWDNCEILPAQETQLQGQAYYF